MRWNTFKACEECFFFNIASTVKNRSGSRTYPPRCTRIACWEEEASFAMWIAPMHCFAVCGNKRSSAWRLERWKFHSRAWCDLRVSVPRRWASAPAAIHYSEHLVQTRLQGGRTPFVTQSDAGKCKRTEVRTFCQADWWRPGRWRSREEVVQKRRCQREPQGRSLLLPKRIRNTGMASQSSRHE